MGFMGIRSEALAAGGKMQPKQGLPTGRALLSEEDRAPNARRRTKEAALAQQRERLHGFSADELLQTHRQLHELFREKPKANITTTDTVSFHAHIVDELARRGNPHPPPPDDGLDERSKDLEAAPNSREEGLKKRFAKPFRSPGGKDVWAPWIVSNIPEHKTYVEPYAGSAAPFFLKEKSGSEVLVDADPEIIGFLRFLSKASDDDLGWLRDQDWSPDKIRFEKLRDSSPSSDRERAFRFKYLNLHSARGRGLKLDNSRELLGSKFLANLEAFRDRLQGVRLVRGDALAEMQKLDAPDTFFYVDPPWKPEGTGEIWKDFDINAFTEVIRSLEGKVLVSYQGKLDLPGWTSFSKTVSQGGIAGESTQEIYANYGPIHKTLSAPPHVKGLEPGTYDTQIFVPILKVNQEKRLLTGEVLIPDEVDAHNETITAEIIEQAAYDFLANFGREGGSKMGLMHKMFGDIGIELVASGLVMQNTIIGGKRVKKGTWLMTVRVVSDSIWNQVKRGELTGFSIGGLARIVSTAA